MTRITVLGSSGFIGSHLVSRLQHQDVDVFLPDRTTPLEGVQMGHVLYCIGVTGDFRTRPFETVYAHVGLLAEILEKCRFDSLLYLSSTRVYKYNAGPATEDDPLLVRPLDHDDLYNLSKLMGESLALAQGAGVRVARLSNVIGAQMGTSTFIPALIHDATVHKHICLQTALDSAKDYIHIDDVTELLLQIALHGQSRVYNIASGRNSSHREIVRRITDLLDCEVTVAPDAQPVIFPPINTERIRQEFGFIPRDAFQDIRALLRLHHSTAGP